MENQNGMDTLASAKKLGTKLWKRRARRFLNNKLATLGLVVTLIFILGAIFADVITRYDPLAPDFGATLQTPTAEHIFGTDSMGRDLFSRVLYGGRISIVIAASSSLIEPWVVILVAGSTSSWCVCLRSLTVSRS